MTHDTVDVRGQVSCLSNIRVRSVDVSRLNVTTALDLIGEVGEAHHSYTLPNPTFHSFTLADIGTGRPFRNAVFRLQDGQHNLAVSWWVSPKRTRSYPYARVYDTLGVRGKKVTVILS